MRAVSSLTNRVFLACTLLASLSLGFAFYFVNERASSDAEADLRRGLLEAGTLVDQYGATRVDHFMRLARVVADLPKLKAAVETGDPPTVQPLADEYRTEVGADLLVLTGRRGALLGAAGADEATIAAAVEDTPSLDEISTFTPHARGVLQLVSVPILLEGEIPDILGRLTVGVFLDDRVANERESADGERDRVRRAGAYPGVDPAERRARDARAGDAVRLGRIRRRSATKSSSRWRALFCRATTRPASRASR